MNGNHLHFSYPTPPVERFSYIAQFHPGWRATESNPNRRRIAPECGSFTPGTVRFAGVILLGTLPVSAATCSIVTLARKNSDVKLLYVLGREDNREPVWDDLEIRLRLLRRVRRMAIQN